MAQSVSGRGAGAVGGESLLLLFALLSWCRHLPHLSHVGRDLVVGIVGVGLGVSGNIFGEDLGCWVVWTPGPSVGEFVY